MAKPASPPSNTNSSGISLQGLEHNSDFNRTEVIHEYDGIYMNWDVYTLWDAQPLSESGFPSVIEEQHAVNVLLTELAERLVGRKEVSILDQKAMEPGRWLCDEVEDLFEPHLNVTTPANDKSLEITGS
ncbi:hypothetical protein BKA56DRAFT_626303 [Ilyonectria sp. MPI-CAGE-AT-0026]|nr:hypothetical protein BKA56DRAFT_626303 [Ilyonectria sp. MPI-CAGE-AT-0026]